MLTPFARIRAAWEQRPQTDYIFDFATALGWSFLSCGFYVLYIFYQLMRRSRDHNLRRLEMLDAATAYAWERANAAGLADELRPAFDRIAPHLAKLRNQTTQFRDPVVWTILLAVAGGIAQIIGYIFLDGDLITHDHAEGAIEYELSGIYARLGAPITPPDPNRLRQPNNYVGRVIAVFATCGIYSYWWMYDVMTDGNGHFRENWRWEDDLAQAVQQLDAA